MSAEKIPWRCPGTICDGPDGVTLMSRATSFRIIAEDVDIEYHAPLDRQSLEEIPAKGRWFITARFVEGR